MTEGDVHRIMATTNSELSNLKIQTTKIEGKLDAIYGNGSGRKGILDRLEDKQDACDVKVDKLEAQAQLEISKQDAFRADIRAHLDRITLEREEEKKNRARAQQQALLDKKSSRKTWLVAMKWVISGLAIATWSVLLEFIKSHHYLGLK